MESFELYIVQDFWFFSIKNHRFLQIILLKLISAPYGIIYKLSIPVNWIEVEAMFPTGNPPFTTPSAQQNANNMNLAAALYLHPSLSITNQAYTQFYQQVI